MFHNSVPSLQFSSFLSDVSSIRGAANRRGIAVCSVAPNPPSVSAYCSEHSPVHKVSWEGEESREGMLERARGEREEEWGARAFELERTQRRGGPQGRSAPTHTHGRAHFHQKVQQAMNSLCSSPSTISTWPACGLITQSILSYFSSVMFALWVHLSR